MNQEFFETSEYRGLRKLYQQSPRSRLQLNQFNSSDTEIVKLRKNLFLTTSIDSIAIEIHSQLYKDPETLGYLAVANSISDLAASGSKPIGLLLSAQWEPAHEGRIQAKVYTAISNALKRFEVPLLGGDSGSSHATVLTTTILGESTQPPLTRTGIRPGDVVLLFRDDLGNGPALAFDYVRNASREKLEKKFRPRPDWQSIYKFRKYFKASIDTSDGIYNSLKTLSVLNDVSFVITLDSLKLTKIANAFKDKFRIPIQYFIESDLGDLQSCIVMDNKLYRKVKLKLPFHQVIAHTYEKSANSITYLNTPKIKGYLPLPNLIEREKFNYSVALSRWMKQFKI